MPFSKMTICIVTNNFPPQPGGIATFYKHLSSLLLKNGCNVIVLIPDETVCEEQEDEIFVSAGLVKIVLRKKVAQYRKKYQAYFNDGGLDAPIWIAMGLAVRDWLFKEQKKYSIDLIEVSDYGGLASFFIDESLPPVAITAHGTFTQVSQYNFFKENRHASVMKQLEDISFRNADKVIVNSLLNKTALEKIYPDSITFSMTPFECTPLENSEDYGLPVIISGLQKIKGSIVICDALRLCLLKKSDLQTLWIGGDTYTAAVGQRMSVFLQQTYPEIWNKALLWLDEKSNANAQEFIRKASFVVIPSEWETFSYVALEAASHRKAIIMTDQTGASHFFTHGKDALIIPANNPKSLADAIIHLITNSELRTELGNNAYSTISNNFKEESSVQARMLIYQKVIENRKLKPRKTDEVFALLRQIETRSSKLYYFLKRFLKKILGRQ
jgi:glycosyltransferase involved in cell wall biosynthesis